MESWSILAALAGVGGMGALVLLLVKILGGSNKSKILSKFKRDEKQEALQDEVVKITREQQIITKQVEASENASEKTKEKIKENLHTAVVEIQETMEEDSILRIDDEMDQDWKSL